MTPAEQLADLRDRYDLSARQIACILRQSTGRVVRAWLQPPGTASARACPEWAPRMLALELGDAQPLASLGDLPEDPGQEPGSIHDYATRMRITAALVDDFGCLGVTAAAAASEVDAGKWDDHPAAK